jgi:MFS family permease
MSSSVQRSATVVLTAAVVVLLIAMGVRATFGLLMQPMGLDKGFTRETFSLAFAIQNLVWGLGAPLFGALSDKYGSGRTIALGAALYALGLLSMGYADSAATLYLSAGVLVGLGQSGTTFGVLLGVVARAFPPEKRSLALGMASAGGSMGQFLMVPFGQQLIAHFDWHAALLVMSVAASFGLPLALLLRGRVVHAADQPHSSLAGAFREAFAHRSYHLLFWSFFVCGFHVSFITLHLPSYVVDRGLSAFDGALAVGLIGLFNIAGSYAFGWLGGRHSKKNLLGWIYALRGVFIAMLLLFPPAWGCSGWARCRSPTGWSVRSTGCAIPPRSMGWSFSATRSAASSACGWAGGHSSARDRTTWCGGSALRWAWPLPRSRGRSTSARWRYSAPPARRVRNADVRPEDLARASPRRGVGADRRRTRDRLRRLPPSGHATRLGSIGSVVWASLNAAQVGSWLSRPAQAASCRAFPIDGRVLSTSSVEKTALPQD